MLRGCRWLGRAQRHQTGGARGCGRVQIFCRVYFEFFDARRAAKIVVLPAVPVDMSGGRWVYIHSADGVALERGSQV
jgi:hypothetical protein